MDKLSLKFYSAFLTFFIFNFGTSEIQIHFKQAEVELRLTQAEADRLSFGCSLINYEKDLQQFIKD